MGLYTQQDPIGIAGGLNLYGYANGDPVNFSDPFGLCPDPDDRLCPAFEAGTSLLFGSAGAVLGFLGGGISSGGNPAIAIAGALAGGAAFSAGGLALGQAVSPYVFSDRTDRYGDKNPLEQLDEISETQETLRGVGQGDKIESIKKSLDRAIRWTKQNWRDLLDDLDDDGR